MGVFGKLCDLKSLLKGSSVCDLQSMLSNFFSHDILCYLLLHPHDSTSSRTCDPLCSVDETSSLEYEATYQPKTDLLKALAIFGVAATWAVAINHEVSNSEEFGTESAKKLEAFHVFYYFCKKSCKPLVVLLEGINLQCEWDLVKAISENCLPVIASMSVATGRQQSSF
ncbi:uncharacterized protein LOC110936411 [Helianthus annuus]|uniref:uncharacterized protein LOC110936411 n=1 Tax=Helianthus annuus TaxID=4232 RepID=UPI000B8EF94F|nr:uncharacterized protein LOC110936411 [Helianthus annuus]